MRKINWIIAKHDSSKDNTFLWTFKGTQDDVKKIISDDMEKEKKDPYDDWDFDSDWSVYSDGGLYNCVCFTDHHIDYDAYPLSKIRAMKGELV